MSRRLTSKTNKTEIQITAPQVYDSRVNPEGFFAQRGVYGLRALQGLVSLAKQHPVAALEQATATAKHRGVWRLRDVRRLLTTNDNVVQVDFLDTHPLIRPLDAYRLEALSPT